MWPASFCGREHRQAPRAPRALRAADYAHGRLWMPLAHRQPHQAVPCRMEFHLVAPAPVAIVSAEHRRVFVRQHAPLDRFGAPGQTAEFLELRVRPSGAFARHRFAQRTVGRK